MAPSGPALAAILVHRTGTRLRLRVPRLRDEPERADALADAVAALDGVTRVLARPATASLIVECASADGVLAALAEGALRVTPPPRPMPVGTQAQLALAVIDHIIARKTDGQWSARSALTAILLAAALYQLLQGRIFGPATTLGMSALSLMMSAGGSSPGMDAGGHGEAGDSD